MKTLTILSPGTDREEWLEARKGWITATTAAAIAGSSPYTGVLDVWNEWTDPAYDRDANRNRWMDERAELGVSREQAIIEWASATDEIHGKLKPNTALVTREGLDLRAACTPDAYLYRRNGTRPIVVDAKATQQDWKAKGVAQHIIDQMLWTYYVTDALEVWIAVERYEWPKGKGVDRTPILVDSYMVLIPFDQVRLDFLKAKVTEFLGWVEADIAPESDIDLTAPAEIDLTTPLEEAQQLKAEADERARFDDLLSELADLTAETAPKLKRMDEIKAEVKREITSYEGRRIHLDGSRFIAKLIRGTRVKLDATKLDQEAVLAATTYPGSETVTYVPNPLYVAPEPTPEDETTTTDAIERADQ